MSSALWAKLELKTLDRAFAGEEKKGHVELGEFIPLSGDPFSGKKAADTLLREARERAADLERDAYDKGFAQGEKDGLELGRKRAETVVADLKRVLEALSGLKEHLITSYEEELLAIVFAVAKKIVRLETLKDETLITRTVSQALRLAADRSEISLKVHPKDLELIEKAKPGLFGEFKDLKLLTVSPDLSVTRGGCMLESPCGDVDGRIETQLEQIAQVMDEAFGTTGS